MSMHGHYQNAYVTHDLDRAIELMSPMFDHSDFSAMDVELSLKTPSGDKALRVRVGLAWVDGLQIEIIQPISGYIDPYQRALPVDRNDAIPRLHHIAMRRDDLPSMRREVENLHLPLTFESGGPGLTCIFLDATARLGHHLEFVCATPEGWEMLGWPKAQLVR